MVTPHDAPSRTPPRTIVVMGVSGCGKTTVGRMISAALDRPFIEADEFHSPQNVAKMAHGIALDDEDRAPWLAAVADEIKKQARVRGVVAACSALRRRYRDVLREADPDIWFLHLVVDEELVKRRVAGRTDHFMPPSLVDSQFADLEPLQPDEFGVSLDGSKPPQDAVRAALNIILAPRA